MANLVISITVTPVTHTGGNNGHAQVNQVSGDGTAPWTYEWRKINTDGSKTVITGQPIDYCNMLIVGNYEYYIKDSSDPEQEITQPFTIEQSIGFNVSLTNVTAYGKADGTIVGQVWGGTAPYTVDLKVNGNEYRIIPNIPAMTSPTDNNINIEELPSGTYTMWATDSEIPPNKCGGDFTYFIMSPPFVTLNGTVNPLGILTTVSFEYGLNTTYGSIAEFGIMNGNVVTPVSAQLSSVELTPATTYHYRIKAVNAYGPPVYGLDETFTTLGALPIVETLPATNIS